VDYPVTFSFRFMNAYPFASTFRTGKGIFVISGIFAHFFFVISCRFFRLSRADERLRSAYRK